MKKGLVRTSSFFEWLINCRDGVDDVVDPVDLAVNNGFRKFSTVRMLQVLQRIGRVDLVGTRPMIAVATIVNLDPIIPISVNKSDVCVRVTDGVIAAIDLDNLTIGCRTIKGIILDPELVCQAIKRYAEQIGTLLRIEVYLTSRTTNYLQVVRQCHAMGISVNIVPPIPNAADDEIRNLILLGLRCPEVRNIVLASQDSGFLPLCEEIRKRDRGLYVITATATAPRIAEGSRSCVRITDLPKVFDDEEPATEDELANKSSGRFTDVAERYSVNSFSIISGNCQDDDFLVDCFQMAAGILNHDAWRSFNQLAREVWFDGLQEDWETKGYSYQDCRDALTAMVGVRLLDSEIRTNKGHVCKVYTL